ncbi:MAG: prephenate dehydrogenase/arogenate dehydrogenase family protein [Pseudomonadales bacterium]
MKIAIVGVGMIGGAVARAARGLSGVQEIVGIEPLASHAAQALELGLVDIVASEVPADADLVVLAAPNEQLPDWVVALRDHAGVVMDVGSVKGYIVREVRRRLGETPANFVPCHPLAGSEKHGPANAPGDLFRNRLVIVLPQRASSAAAVRRARAFWSGLGAILHEMDIDTHDRTLAATSHLPHLLAFAFMCSIRDEDLRYSGGGFADFSRIAASSPELWWGIFRLNREELLQALDGFQNQVDALRAALVTDAEADGLALLAEAAGRRRQL